VGRLHVATSIVIIRFIAACATTQICSCLVQGSKSPAMRRRITGSPPICYHGWFPSEVLHSPCKPEGRRSWKSLVAGDSSVKFDKEFFFRIFQERSKRMAEDHGPRPCLDLGGSPTRRPFQDQQDTHTTSRTSHLLYLVCTGADDLFLGILQELDPVHIHMLRIACGTTENPRGPRLDSRDSMFQALCLFMKGARNGSGVWHNIPSR
jgi:hypothetical protein